MVLGFRMQWQVPECEKDKMNTGNEDEHKISWKCPWFYSNIKDSSSSNTFSQIDKKVRNELLCLLVAWIFTVINILRVIYKWKKNML